MSSKHRRSRPKAKVKKRCATPALAPEIARALDEMRQARLANPERQETARGLRARHRAEFTSRALPGSQAQAFPLI